MRDVALYILFILLGIGVGFAGGLQFSGSVIHEDLCNISVNTMHDYKVCRSADLETVIRVIDVRLNTDEVK